LAAPRFFVATQCAPNLEFDLEPDDAHHATSVLRVGPGERVVVIDATGPWDATVVDVSKHGVRIRAVAALRHDTGELPAEVTVLQALIKGAKFDEVVEKTVELGARWIVPVRCERSLAIPGALKIERWQRIARAAAQQSRRRQLPEVAQPAAWADAVAAATRAMPLIVAWEGAPKGSLAQAAGRVADEAAFAVAVGPEGSFTDDEIETARDAGCIFVSLGPTILRTETAAAAAIAAIAAKCGWW
jgi:16S rRNA (uracil1498-N3)-methyltransferase